MTDRIQARATHSFPFPAERVFDAWLDPETIRVWMRAALRQMGLPGDMQTVEVDARVGGGFVFSDLREAGEAKHWGTYLTLDRPHRIAFTWIVDESEEANPSTVTLSIEPDGSGCVVTIVHDMDAGWRDYLDRTERAWTYMLVGVEESLGNVGGKA